MNLRKLVVVLFSILKFGLLAQPEFDFVKYSTAEGLPSNRVGHVCADPEGFVWAVTSEGLARFDGQRFVLIEGLLPDLRDQYSGKVRLMFSDDRGFLWVQVFDHGVFQIDLTTLKARAFKQDYLVMGFTLFPAACQDAKGNFWISANGGLACYRYDIQDFEFHPFPKPEAEVFSFCKLADGNLFVSTSIGFFKFDVSHYKWNFNLEPWGNDSHVSLIGDKDGTVWMGNWYQERGGFRHYDPDKKQNLNWFSAMPAHPDSIPSTDFGGVFAEDDRIWLATNDQGLVVFDKKTESFHRYQPSVNNPNSFSVMQSFSITKDKFGGLWVGTAQFLNFANLRAKFISHLGYADGLISSECITTTVVSPDKVVFGTMSGLSIYNRHSGSFLNVRLPLFNHNSYNNQIMAVAPCDSTSFWVNTWSSLSRIDLHTGKILEYFITNVNAGEDHPAALMHTDIGTALFIKADQLGNLWMAANGKLIKFSHSEPVRDFRIFQSLANEKVDVNCFWIENEHQLLIGTQDGIVRYDVLTGKGEKLPFQFPFGKEPVRIDFLEKSDNGSYLAITHRRLFRLDPDHLEIAPTEIPIPFLNFSPNGLVEDDQGGIWVSGELGVARLDPGGKASTLYGSRHDLNNNFFSPLKIQIAKDADGNLYFPGSAGVSVIQSKAIPESTPPIVRIVSLKVNNELLPLEKAIYHTREIRLAHYQNDLMFAISVFNSAVPELNRFAYQLEGEKPYSWVELNTQNSLNLANLAPGSYLLRLRGANSDGVWSEAAEPLSIVIRQPWYRTWWAYFLYLLVAGGFLFIVWYFELRRRLAKAEMQRLQELNGTKNRLYANITHEFRTPLTVIMGLTENIKGYEQERNLIRRNSKKLLQLITQMLDLAKFDSGAMVQQPYQSDVIKYLNYLVESFYAMAKEKGIRLSFNAETPALLMDFDEEKLQHVAYNLLSNALKFTDPGGKVTLYASRVKSDSHAQLHLKVQDTGRGIPAESLPFIFDRFFQVDASSTRKNEGTGIGLALTKEYVELMGGEITVSSTLGQGSEFSIILPVKNEAPFVSSSDLKRKLAGVLWEETSLTDSENSAPPHEENLPILLIVEDNKDVVVYIRSIVENDYRVLTAPDGRTGLEKAIKEVPDIIISDVMMPEMDGFELAKTLKNDERTSHIPIILLTARAEEQDYLTGLRTGADAYLIKPFNKDELLVRLEKLTELRRQLQQRYAGLSLTPWESEQTSPEETFLQNLIQIVEAHLDDLEFSAAELYTAANMSQSQLYRKLKALTGKSPALFIRTIRLRKAAELLRDTSMTISEIAWATGFNDPNYFTRVFKEEYGKTPGIWRN